MKKIFTWSLVFVLGVLLIGMFGCTLNITKGNVVSRPGGILTVDKSTIKKLSEFTYRIEGEEKHYRPPTQLLISYYTVTYYTNIEPTVNQWGNLIIKDAYKKAAAAKIYDRETKEFLGYRCHHDPEVEITPPYTKITQK